LLFTPLFSFAISYISLYFLKKKKKIAVSNHFFWSQIGFLHRVWVSLLPFHHFLLLLIPNFNSNLPFFFTIDSFLGYNFINSRLNFQIRVSRFTPKAVHCCYNFRLLELLGQKGSSISVIFHQNQSTKNKNVIFNRFYYPMISYIIDVSFWWCMNLFNFKFCLFKRCYLIIMCDFCLIF